MSTIIDLLMRQHDEVLARIDRDIGRFGDETVAGEFLDFLDNDVSAHFHLEEEVLFPELASISMIANGPLRVMNAEHAVFRDLLAGGRKARDSGLVERLPAVARDLASLLRAHIAKENAVLFPLAREVLGDERLRQMIPTSETPAGEPVGR